MIATGGGSPNVIGFIGNGSSAEQVAALRAKVGDSQMIWTPGVNLAVGDGDMGQRYGHPREAVLAGSDAIIVGSGIHRAESRLDASAEYARASFEALCEREGQ